MTTYTNIPKQVEEVLNNTSRRSFLKGAGMLVVSFGVSGAAKASGVGDTTCEGVISAPSAATVAQTGPYKDPDFKQLDAWIAIHQNNTASFYVGKTDGGQGTGTAFRQMMSDELDMAYDQTELFMGSTDITVDQGGSGGSDGIETDGPPMKRVAAEARRVLLEMAAARFGVSVGQLSVSNGVVTVTADPSKKVTYGELIGGQRFNVTLTATGNNINNTTGIAQVKTVQELKIVGQSIQRFDIPGKVDGSLTWAVDVKVPGMVHARNVRPPVAGATLISVDESSVRGMVRR
jgi:CO/xanthine dehydrogenase Mo-binding subunit